MDDKCYICHENDDILLKTCRNRKCSAKTHSSCLEGQYITLKKCGVCNSDIRVKRYFNCKKLLNFLLVTCAFVLFSYLLFTIIMGLNIFDPFNNHLIFIDNEVNKYSCFNMLIFSTLTYINYKSYMSSFLFTKDILLKELNNRYGKCRLNLWLSFFEITYLLICHCIGYILNKFFYDESRTFYTSKTCLDGILFTVVTPFIMLMLFVTYKYVLPYLIEQYLIEPLLKPFYDEQYGE